MKKQVRAGYRFFRKVVSEWLPIREKPLVIQMPITSRCNSRCVTCNVWKHHEKIDIDDTALKECLKDPFFSEVKSISHNGSEFSLVPRFKEILDALDSLPKLKDVYLITNGLAGQRIKDLVDPAAFACLEFMRTNKEERKKDTIAVNFRDVLADSSRYPVRKDIEEKLT